MSNHSHSYTDEKKETFSTSVQPVDLEEGKQIVDEVFGVINEDGPQFRSLGFWGTFIIMVKTQIGLGVISIPFLFMVVGMIPGVLLFTFVAVAVTWGNYVVGSIKLKHPQVYAIDDVGYLMGGEFGRNLIAFSANLYFIMISGSGMLGLSIAFNALSTHGACTAVFVAVSAIIVWMISSIRTLNRISIVGWIGVISIFAAVFTLMVAVGVQDRPAAAPPTGPWEKNLVMFGKSTMAAAGSTLGGIIYTQAATPAFFSIASEMRVPHLYGRATIYANVLITCVDIMVAVIVYYYCGQYVASPSPGSAGPLLKKVVYGIALPGICISTVIYTHMAAKYLFVRLLRGSRHLASNTWQHWVTWFSCTTGVTLVGYIVGSGIPIFNSLASLIGAFFGPSVSMIPMGMVWLWDNWKDRRTARNQTVFYITAAWAAFVVISGFFLMVAGTYGSIVDIITGFHNGQITKPWSCADNSNSVKSD